MTTFDTDIEHGRYVRFYVEVSAPTSRRNPARYRALVDTGATTSAATRDVIERLGITATGIESVSTPIGQVQTDTFDLDIALPVNTPDAASAWGDGYLYGTPHAVIAIGLGRRISDCDIVLGMDVLSRLCFTMCDGRFEIHS
ncbi:MAG: aspartyl protease family protein [Acidimicrobiaceae bacterium]|nr:aspartyl protease family protein [Acidimicrobiaceae bacterium]